jgi:predicted acyl esterase
MNEDQPGLIYAAKRAWRIAFPSVTITEPAPGIVVDRDAPIELKDGTMLRANVFRPSHGEKVPVIMSAHPYGKDALPKKTPFGYLPQITYRLIRQAGPVTFSAYTSWEAPDPSFWVPRGYAVVNLDLRGFGTSGGTAALWSSPKEADDYAQAIAWAASQSWSTGKIGLNGVSYLAISQWHVAAVRPPALFAICPWEGVTDVYRDLAYPGGIRDDGFLPFWAPMTERSGRVSMHLRDEQMQHPSADTFWAAHTPKLEDIEVPALICASFSDQGLHTRGSFEAFRRIGSRDKFLYTHRGGKWSTYYSAPALALQERFFACYLKGEGDMKDVPRARVEIRERRDVVHEVREATAWPIPGTRFTPLHLSARAESSGELLETPDGERGRVVVELPKDRASFHWRVPEDMEIVGPMKLRLYLELASGTDAHLFAAVRKIVDGEQVPFEGSFGFGCDVVTKGWLRLAHRRVDEARSEPHRPFHPCDRPEPFPVGEVAAVDVELLPSATFFRKGDALRLDIQGKWFWRRSIFRGTFPATYEPSPPCKLMIHVGGERPSHLLVGRAP